MKMKILYIITKANWGGAQKYVYELATAAKAAGHEVVVAYGEGGLLTERLTSVGIRVIPVAALGRDVHLGKDIAAYRALRRLFAAERPDVVHLNSSKAGFTGARAAAVAGVPKIVFTAHGWAFMEPRNPLVRQLFRLLQHLTLRASTQVIAVSASMAELAPWRGLPPDRIRLIPLGIREPDFLSREKAREMLAKFDPTLGRAKNALWVGTVGEINKNKGTDVGFAGWKQAALGNAHWVVIGEGDDRPHLERLARGVPSVHFLGFIADASRYLKAFDLLLVPSRTEALGYVILEAGYAGVPVLTTGVGGIRDAVGPEYPPVMGFFKSGNAGDLAYMLRAATNNRENLVRVGHILEQHVRETFSFDRMIHETLALYQAP